MHKPLEGDSKDYDVITRAVEAASCVGMTCEVGLRRGGGTKYIIDALARKATPYKVHVAIDPFGDLVYHARDGLAKPFGYTNQMRDESLGPIYDYAKKTQVNFVFINLDDEEFFRRYGDGVPVYNDQKRILNQYMFVHLDGPHQLDPLFKEFDWFNPRMPQGATMVFDDVGYYDHNKLEVHVLQSGWKLLEKTPRKAAYKKE